MWTTCGTLGTHTQRNFNIFIVFFKCVFSRTLSRFTRWRRSEWVWKVKLWCKTRCIIDFLLLKKLSLIQYNFSYVRTQLQGFKPTTATDDDYRSLSQSLSLPHSCQSSASHVVSGAGASQRVEQATFREANNCSRRLVACAHACGLSLRIRK